MYCHMRDTTIVSLWYNKVIPNLTVILCHTNLLKTKTAVSIDIDLLKWIESEVKRGRFASKSHGISFCVRAVKEADEQAPLMSNARTHHR